jgi:hypothetical protein
VEATNVWDTSFHQIIALQPHSSPKWETALNEAALYLIALLIVAIILSLSVYAIQINR